jgi:hypothetical protein
MRYLLLIFLLVGIIFATGCIGTDSITNKNQNTAQNAVLTSNGKSIEVNLIKSGIKESSIYEFIFEIRNLGDKGITLYHPFSPNTEGVGYDIWLEDYGGFKYDIMVDGVYEKLSDGSYKNNLKNVGGSFVKVYPNEKILIGTLLLPQKADIDKLKVKTTLHFSSGKSESTWDVTSLFKG